VQGSFKPFFLVSVRQRYRFSGRAVTTTAASSFSMRRRPMQVRRRQAVPPDLLVTVPLQDMAGGVVARTQGLMRMVATCANAGASAMRMAARWREPPFVVAAMPETEMASIVVTWGKLLPVPVAVPPRAPRRRLAGMVTPRTLSSERPRRALY